MKQQYAAYQVVPYPKMQRLEAVADRSVQHKPMIHGLIEVDVTRARARLREHKATTGESLSLFCVLARMPAKEFFNSQHLLNFLIISSYLCRTLFLKRDQR